MCHLTQAVTLAGHLLLREYYAGGFTLRPELVGRLDELLRPFAERDRPLTPALKLDERIAELEEKKDDLSLETLDRR